MGADDTYVESQVIMTTVRVVAPFAFTYGLFLTFHGGGSPGGGFQGGAVIGTTVLMIAFAFGIEPTRDWLSNRVVVGLASGGVLAFALIGLVPLLVDGRFLEHAVFDEEFGLYHGKKYALEGVEIVGIAPIVAAIVIGLFFAIAAGFTGDVDAWHPAGPEGPPGTETTPGAGGGEAGATAAGDGSDRDAATGGEQS
ncbi:monovalent cation/H+ antiporter subunit B [Salinarchaeum sp. Harcht-Bsk1]|nr:monovalent cation/H+ antiporter subunit B [Salinarchaeum sp. Harcht-Bsk1]